MPTQTPEQRAFRWNYFTRHIVRILLVAFTPLAFVFHLGKAVKDTCGDLVFNVKNEMRCNWRDLMQFWELTGKRLGPEYFRGEEGEE